MKTVRWKKNAMTLVELMIVMAIIAMIGGVIMFNLHGSTEKSKEFVTQQKMQRLQQALTLQLMEKPQLASRFPSNWKDLAKKDPLLKGKGEADSPTVDAWGHEFEVRYEKGEVIVQRQSPS